MADVDVTDAMGRTAVRGAMRETASGVDPEGWSVLQALEISGPAPRRRCFVGHVPFAAAPSGL